MTINHDGMGNITNSHNGYSFVYDAAGRLTKLEKNVNQFVENIYNGKGERSFSLRKMSSTSQFVEYYTYAEDGRLLTFVQIEQDPATSALGVRTVYSYVWLGKIPVAQFRDEYQSNGTYSGTQLTYLHADHLATPRMGTGLTTSVTPSIDDAVVWRINGTAYGFAWQTTDPDADGNTVAVALRFPGQVYYGLGTYNYNYFRDYDTFTGRYLESDPIGLAGGSNTFAYVNGNPLRYYDPYGLWTWPTPSEVIDYWTEVALAAEDFHENHEALLESSPIAGRDKYFHCKANCEAAQRGPAGSDMSCMLSNAKELYDSVRNLIFPAPGRGRGGSAADQVANTFGRHGGELNPTTACSLVCSGYRPTPLPLQY